MSICKKLAVDNLLLLKEILDKHCCEWWISDGTLLGAVREKNFISHDTDTDIGINWDTFSKKCFYEILRSFRLVNIYGYVEDSLELTFERNQIKTDLFFFYQKSDFQIYHSAFTEFKRNKFWRLLKFIKSFGGDASGIEKCIPLNFKIAGYMRVDYIYSIFELSTIEFLGENFNCPNDPEKFLECKYGLDWKVPKLEWDYAFSPLNHSKTNIFISQSQVNRKFLQWLKS